MIPDLRRIHLRVLVVQCHALGIMYCIAGKCAVQRGAMTEEKGLRNLLFRSHTASDAVTIIPV